MNECVLTCLKKKKIHLTKVPSACSLHCRYCNVVLWISSNFLDVTWCGYRSRALRGRIIQEIQNLDLNLFSFTSLSKHVYSCTDHGLKRLKHVTLTRQGTSETSLTYTLMITTDHNKSTNVTDVHPCHTCLITHPPQYQSRIEQNKWNRIIFFPFFNEWNISLGHTLVNM